MQFCWSTLYVKDMEESLRFYTQLVGLPVVSRYPAGPGREIAFLGDGDAKVELIYDKAADAAKEIPNISWGFRTPSLDEAMERVRAYGIAELDGPYAPAPGTRFFFIRDPNGLSIQFVEQSKA